MEEMASVNHALHFGKRWLTLSMIAMFVGVGMILFAIEDAYAFVPTSPLSAEAKTEVHQIAAIGRNVLSQTQQNIESTYGKGSVYRWDWAINTNARIGCRRPIIDGSGNIVIDETTGKAKTRIVSTRVREDIAQELVAASIRGAAIASRNKKGIVLSPRFVYTVLMSEGVVYRVQKLTCAQTLVSGNGNLSLANQPISSSRDLGLDFFLSDLPSLKKYGFVRAGFDAYSLDEDVRSRSRSSTSKPVLFTNIYAGAEATAGRLAYARLQFHSAALHKGVLLWTEEEDDFWTYLFYNIGQTGGERILLTQIKDGKIDDTFMKAPEGKIVSSGRIARYNAIIRVATVAFLDKSGILENKPQFAQEAGDPSLTDEHWYS
jgi:hypothetical protein